MLYGVVYRITNLENDKCYIGRTTRDLRKRWHDHCSPTSRCTYLKHAIEKYGKESFKIEAIASSWDAENLKELEALLIIQENTLSPNGYNLINNGEGGSETSEETRKRKSESRIGIIFSEEHRRNISLAQKGKISHMKGKHFSEESRKNMGYGMKGKKASEETKKKASATMKTLKWYTDGIRDCRIRDGNPIPENFRLGRTKGLDNLAMLADSWNNPDYRRHMSEVHKKRNK